jgi:hypothetical protein
MSLRSKITWGLIGSASGLAILFVIAVFVLKIGRIRSNARTELEEEVV